MIRSPRPEASTSSPAPSADGRGPGSARIGPRLKQLVLTFGAVYLGMVALTNLVNVVSRVSDSR